MGIVHSSFIFLWSESISSVDKPIAASLPNQDFHEPLQLQVYREKLLFGTEGVFLTELLIVLLTFLLLCLLLI